MPSRSPDLSSFGYFVDHESTSSFRLPPLRSIFGGQSSRDAPTIPGFTMQGDFIDLTDDISPANVPSLSQQHSSQPQRKRRRVHDYTIQREGSSRPRFADTPAETPSEIDLTLGEDINPFAGIDLTNVEEEVALRRQQEEQLERHADMLRQQDQLLKDSVTAQLPSRQGPLQISKLSCVICLETMTDMTATHCGHLFCHACLMAALSAAENQSSEPGKGLPRCPICRKKVLRNKKAGTRDLQQVIPLELKLMARRDNGKGKARE